MKPKPPPPVPLDPSQPWLFPQAFPSAGGLWDAVEPEPKETIMQTRNGFLSAYRAELLKKHGTGWAADVARVDSFMATVERSLREARTYWFWDDGLSRLAWRAIGAKGRMTFKGLCALPGEAVHV